jgi:hypothetical protein
VLLTEDEESIDEIMAFEAKMRCMHPARPDLVFSFEPIIEAMKERLQVVPEGDEDCTELTTFPATPNGQKDRNEANEQQSKGRLPDVPVSIRRRRTMLTS